MTRARHGKILGYHSFGKKWIQYRETLKADTGRLEHHLKVPSRFTYFVVFLVRVKDFYFILIMMVLIMFLWLAFNSWAEVIIPSQVLY